jgi:hypothetical protein
MFHNIVRFYSEELLACHATPKLENHPLSGVHISLFSTYAANSHIWIISKWIFKKWNGEAWAGFIWLRRGTVGVCACV